ncbi:hypothetical protein L6164_032382 [Bauhinia variegata]|uniref:Uncharacterized protein n=1 Tax=Bauhinia variegata TaxID=167791 RepID=A0ACB9KNN9_BAUVA|nr:hypothetical protein L6164_032382 [Bauhinia variegata]
MEFLWFLVFYAQLATTFSLVQFEDNDMQLSLYHIHTIDSSQTSTSSLSFSGMFAKDKERVRVIHSRLANNVDINIGHGSPTSGAPKPGGIPVQSGISIGSGNYYVKIGLGTPAQYFSMLVDTGSSLCWLQCQPCNSYCHFQVDPIFKPSTSKTYKTLPCSSPQCSSLKNATNNDPSCETATKSCLYRETYTDSSFSTGYLSQDVLTLTPSQTLPNFVYGCGQNNLGLFGMSAGILGLAPNDKLSMLAQLSTKYGYAFSYCLPTYAPAANSSAEGFLSIGNSSLARAPFKFTPMVKNPKFSRFYLLDLTSINVAGRPLEVSASSYKVPTVIDSGTVITRLPMSLYEPLQNAFVKIMSRRYKQAKGVLILDTCFEGSLESMVAVPEIQMMFRGGADLTLGAHNTLIEMLIGVTCLAFTGIPEPNAVAIIGNFQQQTISVAYDVSNSRIGFAGGGCK